MPGFYFEREVRTEHSECYTILEDEQPIGRVDLHFTPGIVHATLCVAESLTQEHIQELVETVDEELVDVLGVARDDYIVHVHQGVDLGVFTIPEFDEEGEGA